MTISTPPSPSSKAKMGGTINVLSVKGGDEITFLVKRLGITRREAIRRYLELAGFPTTHPKSRECPKHRESPESPECPKFPVFPVLCILCPTDKRQKRTCSRWEKRKGERDRKGDEQKASSQARPVD
jgi:hypothetical protein